MRSRCKGFTLLEIAVSTAVLLVLAKFTIDALQGLRATKEFGTTRSRMVQSGEEALLAIIADLNASGVIADLNGKPYPFLFDDGFTGDARFAIHDHAPAVHQAVAGDPAFGPTREIVFVRPADANGDDVPDVDPVTGRLVFDASEFSYVLVTDAQGRNVLERRTDGASGVPVAYGVERVRFDDASSAGVSLPAGSIRVRIWYRSLDGTGVLQRFMAEATVRLRNG